MNKFRIHVLGLPHTITNEDFVACAYTQKALKFCKMMKDRGHTIYHYGHEDSDTLADENVTVITNEVWDKVYGTHDYKSKWFKYDLNDLAYETFFKNTIVEIEKRKKPNDIILPFWGPGVKPICDAHSDLIVIEPGIGYAGGHWAPFKVFESYAIYHAYCGLDNVGKCNQKNYDVVIPNYFDLDEFTYESNKEDYFLYLGRVYDGKGMNIVLQVAEATGIKLKIAGQIDPTYEGKKWPDYVEFVGYADIEKRKELMKNAKGSFLASQYLEPFGGVQIENLLSGTPTITSDWGAFAENNIEGVTGYRCRTFEDYVKAVKNIQKGEINSKDCREQGEKFSLENIVIKYEDFFRKVTDIFTGRGWYEILDESLYSEEWLKKFDIKKKNKKLKVLYFGNACPASAMGIVHRDMKNIIEKKYNIQFDILDWALKTDGIFNSVRLFEDNIWKNYDFLVCDPGITDISQLIPEKDKIDFKSKLLPVYHTELDIESEHFKQGDDYNWFTTPIGGINNKIVNQIKEKGYSTKLLPIGIDSEKWKPFKKVKKIKRVGFIGPKDNIEEWTKIKRPQLFGDICEKAGVEPIYIKGRENNWQMYEDIDLIICTSTVEGLPTAFQECVASKIPFISTKVGIVNEYKEVKTFNTVDEAVKLINELNENEDNIQEYVDKLYDVIIPERKWENVLEKYWMPYFKKFSDDFITTPISVVMPLKSKLDNQAAVLDIVEQPFGTFGNRKLKDISKPSSGEKNDFLMKLVETIPNHPYSQVDPRCFTHEGVIVDVGCLGWDWCDIFLGTKRVIGIDPQEKPIEGAELFKGFLGPFDGITRLYGEGQGASTKNISSESNLYDMISWKTLCSKFNIDKVSVLKINIEGAEYPLLHSMTTDDFKKIDQIAISFHDWLNPNQSTLKYASIELLKKVGFKVESIYPRWGWYLAVK